MDIAAHPTLWCLVGMCGRRNREEISQFSVKDGEQYEKYEKALEQFVLAVDSLLGQAIIHSRKSAESLRVFWS